MFKFIRDWWLEQRAIADDQWADKILLQMAREECGEPCKKCSVPGLNIFHQPGDCVGNDNG